MHDHSKHTNEQTIDACCHTHDNKRDIAFLVFTVVFLISYLSWLFLRESAENIPYVNDFTRSVFEIANKAWWGVTGGIFFVGLLSKVPQSAIFKLMGKPGSVSGILKATLAGFLFDLCSHGILMVGVKMYKKGISYGQLCAFLLSSPWNSFSLTLILISLIGIKFTLLFIVLSMAIGIVTGIIVDKFVKVPALQIDSTTNDIDPNEKLKIRFSWKGFKEVIRNGVADSKTIVKWLLFGIIVTALLRTFVSPDHFAHIFGPTLAGLGLTLIFATLLVVCSEGSAPIAADILTRAHAVGNSFTFLMAGVATDYTVILVLKETTGSWKTALLIPLVSLPQILVISVLLNNLI